MMELRNAFNTLILSVVKAVVQVNTTIVIGLLKMLKIR